MIIFVAKRLSSGGYLHEHIIHLWWEDTNSGQKGDMDIDSAIKWLDDPNVHAFVRDSRGVIEAFVVKPVGGRPYIRTKADGRLTDNLLSLPNR